MGMKNIYSLRPFYVNHDKTRDFTKLFYVESSKIFNFILSEIAQQVLNFFKLLAMGLVQKVTFLLSTRLELLFVR